MQKFRYKVGEKMQKCPKCGNTRDGQRKCGHCGQLLRQDDSAKMTRSSKETKKITNIKARKLYPWNCILS